MRRLQSFLTILLAVLSALALNAASSAHAADISDASSSGVATISADPSLQNSTYFPPQVATAGVAVVSAMPPAAAQSCSSIRPCAVPPPATDRVVIDSPKPASMKAARTNGSGNSGARF